jgi:transposase
MTTNFSELINGLNIDESSKAIMQKIVAELLCIIAEKDKIIVEQSKQIESQSLVIKSQGSEILELQRQLKMDSTNSSLPPSSDMNKTKKKSDDDETGSGGSTNRGGKPGHKGTTLNQLKKPDLIKKIMPEQCSCGSRDLRVTGSYEARQEFDVEIKRVVTEHRLIHCKCGSCGLVSKAESDLPSNAFYSEKVKAYAVYMLDRHFMSYERLKEQFADMYELSISEGSISNWRREFANKLGKRYLKELKKLLLACKYINADETGINVAGDTLWAHVNCTDKYTLLHVSPKRGSEGIKGSGVLGIYTGFVVADGWSSYKGLPAIRGIQSCFAHLFRYCVDIAENYQQKWANKVLAFLHGLMEESKALNNAGIANFSAKLRIKYNLQYDKLLKDGETELKEHNYGKNHHTWRFLNRLRKEKSSVLRFLRHTFLPLTNNEAERSLRPLKVKQKISGTCVSLETTQENLDIRSFIATAKKQGQNVLAAMLKLFINPQDFIIV